MGAELTVPQAIQAVRRPIFTTREIAAMRRASLAATSQVLRRMANQGLVVRAVRGVWCVPADPRFTRFALVPLLAGGHPAYVSLLTALDLHGLIGQIPRVVYAATTSHTRVVRTALGEFSFHRIAPAFFAGYDWYRGGRDFLVASPEKAVVDALYLSSRRGRRFGFFPELDLSAGFAMARARTWARRIPDRRIRAHVLAKLEALAGNVRDSPGDKRPAPRLDRLAPPP